METRSGEVGSSRYLPPARALRGSGCRLGEPVLLSLMAGRADAERGDLSAKASRDDKQAKGQPMTHTLQQSRSLDHISRLGGSIDPSDEEADEADGFEELETCICVGDIERWCGELAAADSMHKVRSILVPALIEVMQQAKADAENGRQRDASRHRQEMWHLRVKMAGLQAECEHSRQTIDQMISERGRAA